ncbi:hypothetical protein BC939DRAFT_444430 [Gamsiella multidivaricata]|uniref:uncharacterized protein n=1 Tax=Gamsiella multidivaricata TaxID=101098 RepID=UPI00222116F0|nr:uncharacterized protein BC939DRAFT_444430 [Gamsiella multidivaricata]KAI7828061.1 hypothetical protein BC939DRAFT_444430 [Gamsiella multidivaricata]
MASDGRASNNGLITTCEQGDKTAVERIHTLESELKAEKEQSTLLVQNLKDQLSELMESNIKFKEKLEQQRTESDSHADLSIQLEMTKEELGQAKDEIVQLKETNVKLSSQSRPAPQSPTEQQPSSALAREYSDAKSTIARLETRLAKESERATEIHTLKATQKELQETIVAIRQELGQSQSKYSEVQAELLKSKESNAELETKEASMAKSIEKLSSQLNIMETAEEEGKRKQVVQFEEEKRELLASRDQLNQQLQDLQKQYHDEHKSAREAAEEGSQTKLREQYEEERKSLIASNDSLQQELEALKKTYNDNHAATEKSLKERETRIQDLEKTVTTNEQTLRTLKEDLQKTISERNHFQSQHKTLLDRVSNMKSTLGTKLQADMENINTLRQQIEQLTAQNNSYLHTIKQLEEELMASHDHYEKTSRELEHLRRRLVEIQEDASAEVVEKENLIHELQSRLQREEREREDWETMASEQRASKDQAIVTMRAMERERNAARAEKELLRQELDREIESLNNLQTVLEEFQSAKESEIQFALENLQRKLNASNASLEEYQTRAQVAEEQLRHLTLDVEKARQLEQEVKEKNQLIGKLRHEAVIHKGHLTEAMRRLKEENSQNTVDIPLISNLFISFLNIPRGDQKRFEILQLISGVLKFTDEQREQAGLIRKANSGLGPMTPTTSGSRSPSMEQMRQHPEPKESFIDMWASFLIRESNANATSNSNNSAGNSNSRSPS